MPTRTSRPARLIAAAALAAALLGTGCGGDDEQAKEYRGALTAADKKFDQELERGLATMRAAAQTRSTRRYGEGAERLQRAADEFADRLEALDTPSDAENEQEALTEAVKEFADSIGRMNAAVQRKDNRAIAAEATTLNARGTAVDRAIETLKDSVG